MHHAGFGKRFVAFWIDYLPIALTTLAIAYFFLGFDTTVSRFLARAPGDFQTRIEFLQERNRIRNASLCLYVLYCMVLEASALQATLGKWLLGIQVVDTSGRRLRYTTALSRNLEKFLSFAILGLGCLWVIWSPEKQAWHDSLAGTFVVTRED